MNVNYYRELAASIEKKRAETLQVVNGCAYGWPKEVLTAELDNLDKEMQELLAIELVPRASVASISTSTVAINLAVGSKEQLVVMATMTDGTIKDVSRPRYAYVTFADADLSFNNLGRLLAVSAEGYKGEEETYRIVKTTNSWNVYNKAQTDGLQAIPNGTENTFDICDLDGNTIGITFKTDGKEEEGDNWNINVMVMLTGTTYTSSNESVFGIDEEGILHTLAVGSGTLTIANNGQIIEVPVTVTNNTPTPTKFSVSGKVQNAAGNAIKGATVSIGVKSVQTNDAGEFTITDVENGTHTLSVTMTGYDPASQQVSVSSANVTDLVVTLSPAVKKFTVSGTVTDGTNPIDGATVKLGERSATTNQAGIFSFAQVEAGEHEFAVTKEHFTAHTETLNVQADVTEKEVTLTAILYTVSGTVTDGENPLKGVAITLGELTAETNDSGAYSIADVKAGTHEFKAEFAGYTTVTEQLEVSADVTKDVTMVAETVSVSGVVKFNDAPVVGATVTYTSKENAEEKFTATTTDGGNFAVENVVKGEYIVSVVNVEKSAVSYVEETVNAVVADKEVTLKSAFDVSGTIKGTGGALIEGAKVALAPYVETVTAQNGTYILNLVPVGENTLTVTKEGYEQATITANVVDKALTGQDITLTASAAQASAKARKR